RQLRGAVRPVRFRMAAAVCGSAAVFLASLLVIEGYFRYFYDASDSNDCIRTARRWQQRHIRLNSWGYRDREFPPSDQARARPRVLVLGDSFAFGWGISDHEDMLGPQLERELGRTRNAGADVFTIALPGLNTLHEIGLFLRDGRRLKPDVVV